MNESITSLPVRLRSEGFVHGGVGSAPQLLREYEILQGTLALDDLSPGNIAAAASSPAATSGHLAG